MPNIAVKTRRPYWKNDIDDLRDRAADVYTSAPVRKNLLSAAEVARAMLSIVGYVQRCYGIEETQESCAELARDDQAWASNLSRPPMDGGFVKPAVLQLVVGCAGLLDLANERTVRAALAFWATENDPSIWRNLLK